MNRSALWAGAGCLGCIGVPSLLAIGGAGGYWLAARENPSVVIVDRAPESVAFAPAREERDARDDRREADTWELDTRRPGTEEAVVKEVAREIATATPVATPVALATPIAREIAIATPVARPTATPQTLAKLSSPISTPARIAAPLSTPVVKELAKLASPISTPVAKELAKVAAPIATPAAVVKKLSAPVMETAKAAPIPKSTPRNFDEPELKMAKPAKSAVASNGGGSLPTETEEDVAVASLFGDAPGGSVPVAAPAAAPAAVSNAKLRTIKTKGGPVQVTLGKKIAIQGSDKKTLLGTLEKVEGGWVAVRLGDGKVKIIAESDVVDASEL